MALNGIQIFKLTQRKTVRNVDARHVWLSP